MTTSIATLMKQREEELRKAAEESRARAETHRRQAAQAVQQQEEHYQLLLGGLGGIREMEIPATDTPSIPRSPAKTSREPRHAAPTTKPRTTRGTTPKSKRKPAAKRSESAPSGARRVPKKPALPAAARQNVMHLHVAHADPVPLPPPTPPPQVVVEPNREILQRLEDMEKFNVAMHSQLVMQGRQEEEEDNRLLRLEEDNMVLREQISTLLKCHPLVSGRGTPTPAPTPPPRMTTTPPVAIVTPSPSPVQPPPPPPPPQLPVVLLSQEDELPLVPAVQLRTMYRCIEDLEEGGRDRIEDLAAASLKGMRSACKEVMYRLKRVENAADTAEEALEGLEKKVRDVIEVNKKHAEAQCKAMAATEKAQQDAAAREKLLKEQTNTIHMLQSSAMAPPSFPGVPHALSPGSAGSPSPPGMHQIPMLSPLQAPQMFQQLQPVQQQQHQSPTVASPPVKKSKKRAVSKPRKASVSPLPLPRSPRAVSGSPVDERRQLIERMKQTEEEERLIEQQNKALRTELERVRQKMAGRQADPLPFSGQKGALEGMEVKKVKKRIVPQKVAEKQEIKQWLKPRRPFQSVNQVVTVESGGLKMMPVMDDGNTSELLDTTSSESQTTTMESSLDDGVAAGMPHLKVIASLTEEQVKECNIPLTFWRNVKHVLKQHQEWCGKQESSLVSLSQSERSLQNLVATSLCSSIRISRRRIRREVALRQLQLGGAGAKLEETRLEINILEERKKSLESVINDRIKAGPAPKGSKDEWAEPEFVQDGSDRLELHMIRKEIVEKGKEAERMESERTNLNRKAQILRDEDASQFRHFNKLDDGGCIMLTLIGKGGFSEVWKAFDRDRAEYVAVKVHQLLDVWSEEQKISYVKHARREAQIHQRLDHPHIVRLFGGFDISETAFANVLEYTPHTDLATYLHHHNTLREPDARIITAQLISALSYLECHPTGAVIHYDLKPANVLFFGELEVKITDFGLSKSISTDQTDIELTSKGAGTLWYLPPECFSRQRDARISPKVDVWSCGVILYQMLFGRRPFGHDQTQRGLLIENTIGSARTLVIPPNPKVSKPTLTLLKKMLTFDSDERPTAASLFQNLDLEDEPLAAGEEEPPCKRQKTT